MYYPFSWSKGLFKTLCLFVIAAIVGWYFQQVTLFLLIATLLNLVSHHWHLYRLNQWLWHSKKITPPKSSGIWEHIYDGVYYMQRRSRKKRKELGTIVKRFREGSEALPDAVVVVDSNANIVWCNRLARFELGLRWPDDAGRRIDNLIRHPDFIKFFHAGVYANPIEVESPTNHEKILEYRMMPYGDQHLLLIARDVTRLTQLEQMRKDFVANVSHELLTPLTVLSGYLEIIPNQEMPEAFVAKAYDEMASQTVRMQSLIEQLLALSRIEASTERVYEKVVNVPLVLASIEAEAKSLNKEKQHVINFQVDPELRVYGVDTELRSAFSNLIFNAIHYTPNGGHIDVIWRLEEEQALFAVCDDGEGIPETHISRLTERFYRVDKARSRKTGGSGLGLAIVKHVLSHHNSKLDISSEMGVGSRFSFSLSSQMLVQKSAEVHAS